MFIIPVLFLVMLLTGTVPAAAAEESQSYSVPSANFEVWLNKDGSASIRETWTVKFISGEFTRFYKWDPIFPKKSGFPM